MRERAGKRLTPFAFSYGKNSRGIQHHRKSLMSLEASYMAGDTLLAKKVSVSVKTDLQQQMRYYNSLRSSNAEYMSQEKGPADR